MLGRPTYILYMYAGRPYVLLMNYFYQTPNLLDLTAAAHQIYTVRQKNGAILFLQ